MGFTTELKETYEYYKFLDKCSLNNIIAEDIRGYVNMYLLEEYKEDIINEFGSIGSFSHIMAENFTRNNGNFIIKEEKLNEFWGFLGKLGAKGAGQVFKWGAKNGVKKGIQQGVSVMGRNASNRLGKESVKDILKFTGKKSIGRLTYNDVGKYSSRNIVKGATPKVARTFEKQGAWLAKHSGMDAAQMSEFMEKYAVCPTGCDKKLWTKAFKNTAKNFNGKVKMTNNLVAKEYDALALKTGKPTIGNTAGRAVGGSIGGVAGSTDGGRTGAIGASRGAVAGSAIGNSLKKAPVVLAKGTGKILKKVGMFCLKHPIKAAIGAFVIYQGWLWVMGKDGLFRRIQRTFSGTGGSGGSASVGSISGVYPKIYGKEYAGENPEDYKII